jgi:diacylglycerol kinase family enzyme
VALLAAGTGLAIAVAIEGFPRGLSVLACLALAFLAGWYALNRTAGARRAGALAAVLLLAAAVALVVFEGRPVADAVVIACLALALACARNAFRVHVRLEPAVPPRHPVLFFNPASGGGKATRLGLAQEAEGRGIEAVELQRGADLEQLVREAVRQGADGLAMAGGDGSQAIVAKIAAELDLPYACIPAGTRNHFALDLGVDRDDVVGALDAFLAGAGERRVDLAEVNGRTFVNNVSLGLYAEAVQRPEYRDAKLRTIALSIPDSLGPDAQPPALHWEGSGGRDEGAVILVSNNRYRLGRALGSGTRPRLDSGLLGIAVLGRPAREGRGGARTPRTRQWTERAFEIAASGPVPAGIDGEATVLEPPLRFSVVPHALRVRIAPDHPGASPSALEPDSPWGALAALLGFALLPRSAWVDGS